MSNFLTTLKICKKLDESGLAKTSDKLFTLTQKYADLYAPFDSIDTGNWRSRQVDFNKVQDQYDEVSDLRQDIQKSKIPDSIVNPTDGDDDIYVEDAKGKKRKLIGPGQQNQDPNPDGIKQIIQDNPRDVSTRNLDDYSYEKLRPENPDESYKKFMLI